MYLVEPEIGYVKVDEQGDMWVYIGDEKWAFVLPEFEHEFLQNDVIH